MQGFGVRLLKEQIGKIYVFHSWIWCPPGFFYVAFPYNCIQIPAVCAHCYYNSAIYIQALVYILKTSVLVYISFVNFVPSQRTWHCVLCNFDSLGDPSSCMDKDKEQYLAAPTVQAFLFKKNMCKLLPPSSFSWDIIMFLYAYSCSSSIIYVSHVTCYVMILHLPMSVSQKLPWQLMFCDEKFGITLEVAQIKIWNNWPRSCNVRE